MWIRLPRHKWPKSWSSMEDPVVLLERILYGHPLAGLLWERQFEKILLQHGWEKVSNWECFFVHREKGLFLSVYVDDIKLAGKKQNINQVGLGEPTSSLDHVYLGCTQRQCEISKDIVDNYRITFESRISAGATEKLPCSENLRPTKSLSKCTNSQLHAMMTIISKQKNWNPWESCQKTCSQIVLKCLYLARIGRPDILWSVNKFARSITQRTKACDQRLCRLISNIHHTCEYKQYCHVGNTTKQCRLGLFQDSDFAGDL